MCEESNVFFAKANLIMCSFLNQTVMGVILLILETRTKIFYMEVDT